MVSQRLSEFSWQEQEKGAKDQYHGVKSDDGDTADKDAKRHRPMRRNEKDESE